MERNQFWVLIGLGLAVGLFLQVIKGPGKSSNAVRLAGFSHFETMLDEGREVYVADNEEPAAPARPASVPVARKAPAPAPTPAATPSVVNNTTPAQLTEQTADPSASPTPKPTPVDPKKKAEEDKKKAEEKKKKEKEEKKKKKLEELEKQKKDQEEKAAADRKAEEDQAEQEAAAQAAARAEAEAAQAAAAAAQDAGGGGVPNPAPPVAAVDNPVVIPQTAREWESQLMGQVNPSRTAQFIKYYQTGKIKADVFYAVVHAMLEDSRPKMREQGVVCLTKTPSAQSFTALADQQTTESDASLKSEITIGLQSYTQLGNLRFLMTVLLPPQGQSSDPNASLEAMALIKASAEANLAKQVPSTQADNRVPANSSLTRYYSPFLPALQQIEQRDPNGNVGQNAAQTLADLQTLIATP